MDKDLLAILEREGYTHIRELKGELCGVRDYLFTAAICIGLDSWGMRTRYCYETRTEAEIALKHWDGNGDPLGQWIKQKPEERLGPALKDDAYA